MKIRYDHPEGCLVCTNCDAHLELPRAAYGNPEAIMIAEESMQAVHACKPKRTFNLPTIRTPRPAQPSARERAKYVLGLVTSL